MSSKHVFSSADGLVLKSLRGFVELNPALRLHAASKSVYVHRPSPHTQVAVISGGGAGHEPAHAGYTGVGMLAACVSGDVFASPSAKQISSTIALAAQRRSPADGDSAAETTQKKDVLVIINNYTGDRLNFGLAIEKSRAGFPEIGVDSVVVADDVSLLRSPAQGLVGPRGLAGNILVCKILGALAEQGADLGSIKACGEAVVQSLASIGVGLEHCHVPGRMRDAAGAIGENECEIGLGLHNEPGAARKRLESPEKLIGEMIDIILASKDHGNEGGPKTELIQIGPDGEMDSVVLFVNNLGGMSQLEMGAILDDVVLRLARSGIRPARIYLSSYMTSLNLPGFSISILNVSNVQRTLRREDRLSTKGSFEIDILRLLDDPTEASAWVGVRSWSHTSRDREREDSDTEALLESFRGLDVKETPAASETGQNYWGPAGISAKDVTNGILRACEAVLREETDITRFDTVVGDGDCGQTFAGGAKAVMNALHQGHIKVEALDPSTLIQKLGDCLEASMGGTMGALFAIFFTAWSASPNGPDGHWHWPHSLRNALDALSTYTPARPGDRTIVDALDAFCAVLSGGGGLEGAVKAAREGAEATRGMRARLGRAVYVPREDTEDLPPDPGAWGLSTVLGGFYEGFSGLG